MTRVVLVRHGQTVWHAENRYAGCSDVELTDRGRDQAELLAAWAAGAGLDAIWCSPLQRAQQTASAAGLATGLPVRLDDRLRELDFGDGEGLTPAEMHDRFPLELRAFHADPVAGHLPGGEDPRAAVARAIAALDELVAAHPGRRVLVVAHTTLIRLALCQLLGLPLGEYRRVFPFVRNAALTEIRLGEGPPALLQFNAGLEEDEPRAEVAPAPGIPAVARDGSAEIA